MVRVDALGQEFAELKRQFNVAWLACHNTEEVDDDACRFLFRQKFSSFREQDEHCRVDAKHKLAWLKLHFRIQDEIENMC